MTLRFHPKPDIKGFSLIDIFLVILVVAMVCGVGAFICHHDHKKAAVTNVASAKNVTWESRCFYMPGICFKYPSNWTVGTTPSGVYTSYTDPAKTVVVYNYNTTGLPEQATQAYILGTVPITNGAAGISIIGYEVPNNYGTSEGTPGAVLAKYAIFNTAGLASDIRSGDTVSLSLTGGVGISYPGTPAFSLNSYPGIFFGAEPYKPINTRQQAIAWTKDKDVKTAIQILQSVTGN
jgi:hypothetical protein